MSGLRFVADRSFNGLGLRRSVAHIFSLSPRVLRPSRVSSGDTPTHSELDRTKRELSPSEPCLMRCVKCSRSHVFMSRFKRGRGEGNTSAKHAQQRSSQGCGVLQTSPGGSYEEDSQGVASNSHSCACFSEVLVFGL